MALNISHEDKSLAVLPQSLRNRATACGLHADDPAALDRAWGIIIGFFQDIMRDTLAGVLHSLQGDKACDLHGPEDANELLKYMVLDRPLWLSVQRRLFNPECRTTRPLVRTFDEGGRIYLRPGVMTVFVGDGRHTSTDRLGMKSRFFSLLDWRRGIVPGSVIDTMRLVCGLGKDITDDDLSFCALVFLKAVIEQKSRVRLSSSIPLPRPIGIMWRELIMDEFAYAALCRRSLRLGPDEVVAWDRFSLPSWTGTDCSPIPPVTGHGFCGYETYHHIHSSVASLYRQAGRVMPAALWQSHRF